VSGGVGGGASWVGTFDFGGLDAADAVVVVVDCGLEDYFISFDHGDSGSKCLP